MTLPLPPTDDCGTTSLFTIRKNPVIALDGGELSKEFDGKGMEGMEMGYNAFWAVVAMEHNLLSAAVVNAPLARALCLKLLC